MKLFLYLWLLLSFEKCMSLRYFVFLCVISVFFQDIVHHRHQPSIRVANHRYILSDEIFLSECYERHFSIMAVQSWFSLYSAFVFLLFWNTRAPLLQFDLCTLSFQIFSIIFLLWSYHN